jgi:hypothetical protein
LVILTKEKEFIPHHSKFDPHKMSSVKSDIETASGIMREDS